MDRIEQLLNQVLEEIQQIDANCSTLLNEIEHGLVNVKCEYFDKAFSASGKQLKEEGILAWLIQNRLNESGYVAHWAHRYPTGRQKCDLVVEGIGGCKVWLELKLAWKAWFNCEGEPNYSNRSFSSYLRGTNRSHSFRQDLEKLSCPGWGKNDHRAVCLIGFDHHDDPMTSQVESIITSALGDWEIVAQDRWSDRRSTSFQIAVWCCLLRNS